MDQECRFFENYVRFLQENGFTTRTIIGTNDKALSDFKFINKKLEEFGAAKKNINITL